MRHVHRPSHLCKSDIINFDLSPNNLRGEPIILKKTMSFCDSHNRSLCVSGCLNVLSMVKFNFLKEKKKEMDTREEKRKRMQKITEAHRIKIIPRSNLRLFFLLLCSRSKVDDRKRAFARNNCVMPEGETMRAARLNWGKFVSSFRLPRLALITSGQ